MNFSALTSLDTVYVTVTDFNNMPYLGYALTIVPTGPWVVQDSYVVNDIVGTIINKLIMVKQLV